MFRGFHPYDGHKPSILGYPIYHHKVQEASLDVHTWNWPCIRRWECASASQDQAGPSVDDSSVGAKNSNFTVACGTLISILDRVNILSANF